MVIADTSPLNYLILIGADEILPQLYGEVAVATAVISELRHADTPTAVVQWISTPPPWLRVVSVRETSDETLNELGAGERESIVFALTQTTPVLLLMDETRGRFEAAVRGIVTTGTLGVLDAAAAAGLLDLPTSIDQLRKTTFYATPALFKRLLDRDAARRGIFQPRS